MNKKGITLTALSIIIIVILIVGTITTAGASRLIVMNKQQAYESANRLLRRKISVMQSEINSELELKKDTDETFESILEARYPALQGKKKSTLAATNMPQSDVYLTAVRVMRDRKGYTKDEDIIGKPYYVIDDAETRKIFGIENYNALFVVNIEHNIAFSVKPFKDGRKRVHCLEQMDKRFKTVDGTKTQQKGFTPEEGEPPVLVGGLKLINADTYNYKDKKWANAKTSDNNEFVWIPRFEYKITYYTNSSRSSVKGYSGEKKGEHEYLNTSNNVTSPGSAKSNFFKISVRFIEKSKTVSSDGYIIHPAFRNGKSTGYKNGEWGEELPGFWISKYSISEENNVIRSMPDKPISNRESLGLKFTKAYNFNREGNSHLMKNSEYGAVVYLAYSDKTLNGTEITKFNSYNKPKVTRGTNQASTTGNETGVYDFSGTDSIAVSAYFTNDSISDLNSIFEGENLVKELTGNFASSSKYITKYDLGNAAGNTYDSAKLKYGDSVFETSTNGNGNSSGHNNGSYMPYVENMQMFRVGGFATNTTSKYGMFGFFNTVESTNGTLGGYKIVLCP